MEKYDNLIVRFWAGTATEKEKLELLQLLQENDNTLREAMCHDFLQGTEISDIASELILNKLHAAQQNDEDDTVYVRPRHYKYWFAAASILAAIIAILAGFNLNKTDKSQVASVSISKKSIFKKIFFSNTGNTNKDTLLSDGSSILLYPTSQIVSDTISEQRILLALKGKARFHIKHNTQRLFEVLAQGIRTTDIGTIFTIDAYGKKYMSVLIAEGKIKVSPTKNSPFLFPTTILESGEQISFDFKSKQYRSDAMQIPTALKTKDKGVSKIHKKIPEKTALSFNQIGMSKVCQYLERQYNVSISYRTADLRDLSFTGTFKPEDKLSTCLDILCGLADLKYDTEGTHIYIHK